MNRKCKKVVPGAREPLYVFQWSDQTVVAHNACHAVAMLVSEQAVSPDRFVKDQPVQVGDSEVIHLWEIDSDGEYTKEVWLNPQQLVAKVRRAVILADDY